MTTFPYNVDCKIFPYNVDCEIRVPKLGHYPETSADKYYLTFKIIISYSAFKSKYKHVPN